MNLHPIHRSRTAAVIISAAMLAVVVPTVTASTAAAATQTITVTAKEGRFDAIKLDIDDGDLEMWNVVVTFGDRSKFSPDTRWNFDQGSRSRVRAEARRAGKERCVACRSRWSP